MKPVKGAGIVILDRVECIAKMEEIVTDTTKFKLTENQDVYGISRIIERRVRDCLSLHVKKLVLIPYEQYTKLFPNGSHIGVMYGLSKIHEHGNPLPVPQSEHPSR